MLSRENLAVEPEAHPAPSRSAPLESLAEEASFIFATGNECLHLKAHLT